MPWGKRAGRGGEPGGEFEACAGPVVQSIPCPDIAAVGCYGPHERGPASAARATGPEP
jgi:hypothetical protein